ncbi:MAG: D-aminoacyl-tRNA deacylase, partial [Gammaproteobacteria bacterium]|nr:D-aminoacyl-tRNA deacylase [Gammaproteobacteria bacterium]
MIGLIQRVSSASVVIAQQETARIEGGVLALIGVEKADSAKSA